MPICYRGFLHERLAPSADAKPRPSGMWPNSNIGSVSCSSKPPCLMAQREASAAEIERDLIEARRNVLAVYREVKNASSIYRTILSHDFRPVNLSVLKDWLVNDRAVLLRYYVGATGSWLFIIRPDQAPSLAPLVWSQNPQTSGRTSAGAITDASLRTLLLGGANGGLLAQLNRPETALEVTPTLHQLWTWLIPSDLQHSLVNGTYARLIVIPDGPLALLPFEILVTQPSAPTKYLLDDGPPTLYAPSATLLYNIASRRREESKETGGVLTVGNPIYTARQAREEQRGSLQRRFELLRPQLSDLPFTGVEADKVVSAFTAAGLPVTPLRRGDATEARIRKELPGRRFVHLACHGLCDESHNNFFGALAVTRGEDAGNPTDDGFLTLGEIVELPLQACELSILSACETNFGPQQQGEGTWALSRGFLVAGSRRVVASTWLVDDEAGADLISDFCARLASDLSREKQPDYAGHLRAAKKRVRENGRWNNPYFWGSFVLIGPN